MTVRTWKKSHGAFVRGRRELLKLSQEQLARRAKISTRTLVALELGHVIDPSTSTLVGLANALKVTTDALLGRVDAEPAGRCA